MTFIYNDSCVPSPKRCIYDVLELLFFDSTFIISGVKLILFIRNSFCFHINWCFYRYFSI